MHRKISVKLGTREIDGLITELENYRTSLESKLREACSLIAESIMQEAQHGFDGAYVNDSHDPVQVSVTVEEDSDGTFFVIASGDEAAFVEFGAGVTHNGSAGASPHPKGAELGYTIGSYGKGQGRRKAWGYYGSGGLTITHGTPAQMPLYNALTKAAQHISLILGSVFT